MPYMKFLYVRPDVCRLLLSDSTSQWTPLLLAIQFPLLGLVRDLHPLEQAHAEHTKNPAAPREYSGSIKAVTAKKAMFKKTAASKLLL